MYISLSEWLCLATCVWVNVPLQLPCVRQLWHYCLYCRSGSTCPWPITIRVRLARFSFSSALRWVICRSGLPAIRNHRGNPSTKTCKIYKCWTMPRAYSLATTSDWLQRYAFRTVAFLRCPGSRFPVSELETITNCFETTWVVQGSQVGITAPCTRLSQ